MLLTALSVTEEFANKVSDIRQLPSSQLCIIWSWSCLSVWSLNWFLKLSSAPVGFQSRAIKITLFSLIYLHTLHLLVFTQFYMTFETELLQCNILSEWQEWCNFTWKIMNILFVAGMMIRLFVSLTFVLLNRWETVNVYQETSQRDLIPERILFGTI